MNTKQLMTLMLLVTILFVTACGSTSPTNVTAIEKKPDVGAESEEDLPDLPQGWSWAETPQLGLVAVAGAVPQGTIQYLAVAEEAAAIAGAVKVYAVVAGEFIFQGVLLPASVAAYSAGGGFQDLVEGPRYFFNDGQITTINRATGEIRVIQLEDADASEAENAAAGESEQAKAEEEKVNQNQLRRIAHVEDSSSWQRVGQSMFGGDVITFISCEELIVMLSADPTLNFSAYVLDNDLGSGLMKGPMCVQQILTLRPGSVIIGLSGGFNDPGFVNSGAKTWVSKAEVHFKTFRDLLP